MLGNVGTCKACFFSRLRSRGGPQNPPVLECHKAPPRLLPIPNAQGQMQYVAMWGPVEPDEWCGEFATDPNTRN